MSRVGLEALDPDQTPLACAVSGANPVKWAPFTEYKEIQAPLVPSLNCFILKPLLAATNVTAFLPFGDKNVTRFTARPRHDSPATPPSRLALPARHGPVWSKGAAHRTRQRVGAGNWRRDAKGFGPTFRSFNSTRGNIT